MKLRVFVVGLFVLGCLPGFSICPELVRLDHVQ